MSDPRCLIEIVVFLDGVRHGLRFWPAVPRVGEFIMLREVGGGEEFDASVEAVFWSERKGSNLAVERPLVYLHAKRPVEVAKKLSKNGD